MLPQPKKLSSIQTKSSPALVPVRDGQRSPRIPSDHPHPISDTDLQATRPVAGHGVDTKDRGIFLLWNAKRCRAISLRMVFRLKARCRCADTHGRIHSSILGDDFERDDLVRFGRLWADVWKLTASATGSTDEGTLARRTTGVACEFEFPPGVFLPGSRWGAVLGRH